MENLGFIFGLFGFIVGAGAWQQITSLKKDFESLKKNLEDSGVIREKIEPNNN